MAWNSAIEAEYGALLAGNMGSALMGTRSDLRDLRERIRLIEQGSSRVPDPVFPPEVTSMSKAQARSLWLWRVAHNFYMERNQWWPWRLRDKRVAELLPLLNFGWQGFLCVQVGDKWRYVMEGVWDDRPKARCAEALMARLLWAAMDEPVRTEAELVSRAIQAMRDAGWRHVLGFWEDYADTPRRSPLDWPVYTFDQVWAKKAGECHINANFLAARLRSFNIPAHIGRSWDTLSETVGWISRPHDLHPHGHCCLHFPTLQSWLNHGDDVQHCLLAGIPPLFALKSEWWMETYHFTSTDYEWSRASDYDTYTWWCLLVGKAPDRPSCDVPYLYRSHQLRKRLETVHIENRYAEIAGAPDPVPPLFTAAEVDTLMNWVAARLG